MKIILALAALLILGGCANQPEKKVIKSANSAHGRGTVESPYIVNVNGLYKTDKYTFYKTRPLQKDCVLVVGATDAELWYARMFNMDSTEVQPVTRDMYWTFNIRQYGMYDLTTRAYTKSKIRIYSRCLTR